MSRFLHRRNESTYRLFFFLVFGLLLSNVSAVRAELYKWVDKDGNVHFSDTPPPSAGQSAPSAPDNKKEDAVEKIGFDGSRRSTAKPIPYMSSFPPRKIKLVTPVSVKLEQPPLANGKFLIGVVGAGAKCREIDGDRTKIFFDPKKDELTGADKDFYDHIAEYGYLPKDNRSKPIPAELKLRQTFQVISIRACLTTDSTTTRVTIQDGMWVDSQVKLKIHWELFHPATKEIYFQKVTLGEHRESRRYIQEEEVIARTIQGALAESMDELLADEAFVQYFHPEYKKEEIVAAFKNAPKDSLEDEEEKEKPKEGSKNGSIANAQEKKRKESILAPKSDLVIALKANTSLLDMFTSKFDFDKLAPATVTVKVAGGHGSGFLLTDDGYVLTNWHVVEDAGGDEVKVLYGSSRRNEQGSPAAVKRMHKRRDVALLKIQKNFPDRAVVIAQSKPKVGERIYVIGTPLDERLHHTVTSGVISAYRQHEGLNYYQTDAAINPGNSGGPAFNEKGEVIGLAVAGIFTEEGASMNVNFLIPIEDALQQLRIRQKIVEK